MSVFKRKYTSRDGKAKTVRKYSVDFRDHDGVLRRVAAFSDKAASVELERNLNRLVALRLAGTGPDAELSRFLEACPFEIRNRLAKWGIIEGTRAAVGKALTAHIDDWRLELKSKGRTRHHVKTFAAKVKAIAVDCG